MYFYIVRRSDGSHVASMTSCRDKGLVGMLACGEVIDEVAVPEKDIQSIWLACHNDEFQRMLERQMLAAWQAGIAHQAKSARTAIGA